MTNDTSAGCQYTGLEVYKQRNGGRYCYYPVSLNAQLLCLLMGRKCFVDGDLELLKQLNYTLKLVIEPESK